MFLVQAKENTGLGKRRLGGRRDLIAAFHYLNGGSEEDGAGFSEEDGAGFSIRGMALLPLPCHWHTRQSAVGVDPPPPSVADRPLGGPPPTTLIDWLLRLLPTHLPIGHWGTPPPHTHTH